MPDAVNRIVALGREAVQRGLRIDRFELSSDAYAEVRAYVEARAGFTGSDVAEELGRNDPRSPYWGGQTRAEKLRAAAIMWHLEGLGQVSIVEKPSMTAGTVAVLLAHR